MNWYNGGGENLLKQKISAKLKLTKMSPRISIKLSSQQFCNFKLNFLSSVAAKSNWIFQRKRSLMIPFNKKSWCLAVQWLQSIFNFFPVGCWWSVVIQHQQTGSRTRTNLSHRGEFIGFSQVQLKLNILEISLGCGTTPLLISLYRLYHDIYLPASFNTGGHWEVRYDLIINKEVMGTKK